MSPRAQHGIEKLEFNLIVCRCGWEYKIDDPGGWGSGARQNLLLDNYNRHRKHPEQGSARLALLAVTCAGLAAVSWIVSAVLHRDARSAAEAAVAASERALDLAAAPCAPVYTMAYPEFGCRGRFGWPPLVCEPRVVVYRHTDPAKVRGRIAAAGMRPGMVVYEERGVRERALPLEWDPRIGGMP